MLEGVSEYYNATRGIVSNDTFEYGRPGEVLNNYTSSDDVEVKPERYTFHSTTKLS